MNDLVKIENDLKPQVSDAREVLSLAKGFAISSNETYEMAVEGAREAGARYTAIKTEKEKVTKPLKATVKQVEAWFDVLLSPLDEAKRLFKEKATAYQIAQAEEQRKALAATQAAFQAGDEKAVEAHALQAATAMPEKVKGAFVTDRWSVEIVDEKLVPREFLIVDVKKLDALARAMKGDINIPGVKAVNNPSMTVR